MERWNMAEYMEKNYSTAWRKQMLIKAKRKKEELKVNQKNAKE